jgi:hypothetical protein
MIEEQEHVNNLRPYQAVIADAVLESVFNKKGLTFTVEIARQGGKNELSAHLEVALLFLNMEERKNIVKCSPTLKPQGLISVSRLKDRFEQHGFESKIMKTEHGHIIRFGLARAIFLSAEPSSNVVGNTAHLLLEIDEAQDVDKDKYTKEFRPMASAHNATTVLYGTTWDESTLLEEVKQTNLELEQKDGVKRHFRYDWEEVAKYNPDYLAYVEAEKARLGENHPLFLTQYRLLPLHGGGGFLSAQQRAQLQGGHARLRTAGPGKIYVAGIDLAGAAESDDSEFRRTVDLKRDSTVVTIAELDFSLCDDVIKEPSIRVVEHYRWVDEPHPATYARLVDILKSVWHCRKILVDATGVGEPVASFLRKALGSRVERFVFTSRSKSDIGFGLLAAINSGRLKVYQGDGSAEITDFWLEMERAKTVYRPSRTMNFFVPPSAGHDDFLMSLALVTEAGNTYLPKKARGE